MSGAFNRSPLAEILERSYSGRRVLVTGHNGFVGSWLTWLLVRCGAEVVGLSLGEQPGHLAEALRLGNLAGSIEGDIRDRDLVDDVVRTSRPDAVFHLAAQALVLPSFIDPITTFTTNVMGTAHVLDAVRSQESVRSCVVVTSDKCYATASGAHVESDPLGGDDPYSASKGAAEIVTHAYRESYFARDGGPLIATARAGNIVGGGDWAADRVVPDCIRAIDKGEAVRLRHPEAIRPWQHVLDAIAGYLRLGDALCLGRGDFAAAWNFGPPGDAAATVGEFVSSLHSAWRALGGSHVLDPVVDEAERPPERTFLTLDSTKATARLGWRQVLELEQTVEWTAGWYCASLTESDFDARDLTSAQIDRFLVLDGAL